MVTYNNRYRNNASNQECAFDSLVAEKGRVKLFIDGYIKIRNFRIFNTGLVPPFLTRDWRAHRAIHGERFS